MKLGDTRNRGAYEPGRGDGGPDLVDGIERVAHIVHVDALLQLPDPLADRACNLGQTLSENEDRDHEQDERSTGLSSAATTTASDLFSA